MHAVPTGRRGRGGPLHLVVTEITQIGIVDSGPSHIKLIEAQSGIGIGDRGNAGKGGGDQGWCGANGRAVTERVEAVAAARIIGAHLIAALGVGGQSTIDAQQGAGVVGGQQREGIRRRWSG